MPPLPNRTNRDPPPGYVTEEKYRRCAGVAPLPKPTRDPPDDVDIDAEDPTPARASLRQVPEDVADTEDLAVAEARRTAFVKAYLNNGYVACKAAIAAGYSPRTARSAGSRLLKHPGVKPAIDDHFTAMQELGQRRRC